MSLVVLSCAAKKKGKDVDDEHIAQLLHQSYHEYMLELSAANHRYLKFRDKQLTEILDVDKSLLFFLSCSLSLSLSLSPPFSLSLSPSSLSCSLLSYTTKAVSKAGLDFVSFILENFSTMTSRAPTSEVEVRLCCLSLVLTTEQPNHPDIVAIALSRV